MFAYTLFLPVLLAATDSEKKEPQAELPKTLEVRYQGRNAESWSKGLFDADNSTSTRSGHALNGIGKEGLRFMLQGMKSEIEHVRRNSVGKLNYTAAKGYPKVFIPALTMLLEDKSDLVRGFAAAAFNGCGFKDGLPAMRKAHEREKSERAKNAIGNYIAELEKK